MTSLRQQVTVRRRCELRMGSGRYSAVVRSRFAAANDGSSDDVSTFELTTGHVAWGINHAGHVPSVAVEGAEDQGARMATAGVYYYAAKMVLVVAVACYVAGLLFFTGSMIVMGVGAMGFRYNPGAELLRARLQSARTWSNAGNATRYGFSFADDYHPTARVVSTSRALLRATCTCPGMLPPRWAGMLAVIADTDGVLWLDKMTEREARALRSARTATAPEMTALGTNGTMLLDVHARRKPPVRADEYYAHRPEMGAGKGRRSGLATSSARTFRRTYGVDKEGAKGGRRHRHAKDREEEGHRSSMCACAVDGASAVLAPLHWPGPDERSWDRERASIELRKLAVAYLSRAWAQCLKSAVAA